MNSPKNIQAKETAEWLRNNRPPWLKTVAKPMPKASSTGK